jgi:hypothetical protein
LLPGARRTCQNVCPLVGEPTWRLSFFDFVSLGKPYEYFLANSCRLIGDDLDG